LSGFPAKRYIERGLEAPVYGPRQVGRPNTLAPYLDYLRKRLEAFPDLTAVRLTLTCPRISDRRIVERLAPESE
jgi:hypothetical protein